MSLMKRRCVFFDRDGIVNKAPRSRYVERWEDFHIQPEFVAALRETHRRGYVAVVVTNQKGIAKGVIKARVVRAIHSRLCRMLSKEHGLQLLDVMVCPHGDNECVCRKPQPGMLLKAALRHDIDLKKSWMIGDQERDVEAGLRAGCRTVLVENSKRHTRADYRFKNMGKLAEGISLLLKR